MNCDPEEAPESLSEAQHCPFLLRAYDHHRAVSVVNMVHVAQGMEVVAKIA